MVFSLGLAFFISLYSWSAPTALLAAPLGAVKETVVIVRFDLGNSNEWILGTLLFSTERDKLYSFRCFLKKYSGPFLLLPPVNKSVSIFECVSNTETKSRNSICCIPKSLASTFSRRALATISQMPKPRSCKNFLRCAIARSVVSYCRFKSKSAFKMGHNCPSLLP